MGQPKYKRTIDLKWKHCTKPPSARSADLKLCLGQRSSNWTISFKIAEIPSVLGNGRRMSGYSFKFAAFWCYFCRNPNVFCVLDWDSSPMHHIRSEVKNMEVNEENKIAIRAHPLANKNIILIAFRCAAKMPQSLDLRLDLRLAI